MQSFGQVSRVPIFRNRGFVGHSEPFFGKKKNKSTIDVILTKIPATEVEYRPQKPRIHEPTIQNFDDFSLKSSGDVVENPKKLKL